MRVIQIAVAVPIISLLLWCGLLEYNALSGEIIKVRAIGYDPRDLLSGHYLRFQLDLLEYGQCSGNAAPNSTSRCVCFEREESSDRHRPMWAGACDVRPGSCTVFLKGVCEYGRFRWGAEQYFIPEQLAPALQTVPPESSALIAVSKNGGGQIVGFLVGEELVESYASRKVAEMRNSGKH